MKLHIRAGSGKVRKSHSYQTACGITVYPSQCVSREYAKSVADGKNPPDHDPSQPPCQICQECMEVVSDE